MKTGIFYLFDKNNDIKNLKTSLYFLFKNFNHTYQHNVFIMHKNGDITKDIKHEILMNIRENSRNLMNFLELPDEMFEMPKHIDIDILRRIISMKPVPNWGDQNERIMNYFWSIRFWQVVNEFDYVMRLDDDLFIEEPIREDFFKIMENKNYNVMFNMLKSDCPIGNFGFKELLDQKYPEKTSEITQYFSHSKLTEYNSIEAFKSLYKVANKTEYKKTEIDLQQPIVCQDSFYITRVSFWNSSHTKQLLDIIDKLGFIFYYKWTTSSIISLLSMVQDKDKISRCIFRMSKEFHRIATRDNNNEVISNLPNSYDLSGCITSK